MKNIKKLKTISILVLIGLVLQIGSSYLLNGILEMLSMAEQYEAQISVLHQNSILMILYVSLAAPIIEELIFRLFVPKAFKFISEGLFKVKCKFFIANIFQALLFGIYHGNLIQGAYAFLIGLVLGYICSLGNVFYSIAVHITINITGLMLMGYLPENMPVFVKCVIGVVVLCCLIPLINLLRNSKHMYIAETKEIQEIYRFYCDVVEYMDTYGIKLGWDIEKYPNLEFVENMVNNQEMLIKRDGDKIICAAAVNHEVNPEYDDIDWEIKGPKDRVSTIHALAVAPTHRTKGVSDDFLKEIEGYCKKNGDTAIHFDVIDFNTPALNLYMRNGYKNHGAIEMYYEVVGTKKFYMIEKVLYNNN